jgi:TolB-like protein
MKERQPRKLAVILHADVVGSTALVQRNESLAHARIQDAFRRFSLTIEAYSGVTHELRGDALVAEFARASDAVAAGLAFQIENTESNARLEDDLQPRLRIGISLGEVVIADNTVTGEGVVLAQRLEQLASGGGVCIQGAVYEAVPGRLPFEYGSLGEQELKGFSEPVRAYTVTLKAGETIPPPELDESAQEPRIALPEKPSIAVLPLTNMSGDPEQEYFSDGITEDIITELSRFRDLFVIARYSSFSYKGKTVKVQEIAVDLGVRYVVEGSVRTALNQIRVTIQLIDAVTGHHVWAEHYDRKLEEVFEIQDEITHTVVATIAGRLRMAAQDHATRKRPQSLGAYDLVLRGQAIAADSEENNLRARRAYEKAIEMDPTYARAYVGLAICHKIDWMSGWGDSPEASLDRAYECAVKAVVLDDADSKAQARLGDLLRGKRQFDEAEFHFTRALELNPNDADSLALWAYFLSQIGRYDEAIERCTTAIRLNPYHPAWYLWVLGEAYYLTKRYKEALVPLREAANRNRKARWALVVTYAQLNQVGEARKILDELLAEEPHASLRREPWYKYPEDEDHWLDGLRKAGLTE